MIFSLKRDFAFFQQGYKIGITHLPVVKLDEYVIMPNHLHGILIITKQISVETCHGMSLHKNEFSQPQPNSLPTIINQFKSSVKRYSNKQNLPFHWQSRYYDHVIRNESSYLKIKEYIKNNPRMWEQDEENPINNAS